MQERAPDGTNTITSADNVSVIRLPNGSIVTSPEVKLQVTPDRDIRAKLPRGDVVTIDPRGSMWMESPDGAVRGIGADGTSSVTGRVGSDTWNVITSPDGSKWSTTYTRPNGELFGLDSAGTISTVDRSGLGAKVHADGTTVLDHPDGVVEVWQPDGTRRVTKPDVGTITIESPPRTRDARQGRSQGDLTAVVPPAPDAHAPDTREDGGVVDTAVSIAETMVDAARQVRQGAFDATGDLVHFFWDAAPLRMLIDPEGHAKSVEARLHGIATVAEHPLAVAQAAIDQQVQAWRDNFLHEIGRLVPDLVLGFLTAGEGPLMTRGARVLENIDEASAKGIRRETSLVEAEAAATAGTKAGTRAEVRLIEDGIKLSGDALADEIRARFGKVGVNLGGTGEVTNYINVNTLTGGAKGERDSASDQRPRRRYFHIFYAR